MLNARRYILIFIMAAVGILGTSQALAQIHTITLSGDNVMGSFDYVRGDGINSPTISSVNITIDQEQAFGSPSPILSGTLVNVDLEISNGVQIWNFYENVDPAYASSYSLNARILDIFFDELAVSNTGLVRQQDVLFLRFQDNDFLGSPQTVTFTISPVPEPSTYAMMALGLLGVAGLSRRRRSQG